MIRLEHFIANSWYRNIQLICLVFTFHCFVNGSANAQKDYNVADSLQLFQLLDQVDELDFAGELGDAMNLIDKVILKSQLKHMDRCLGFAYLKKADLLLKKSILDNLLFYYQSGLDLGKRLNDSLIMGLSYHQKSQYFRELSEYPKALLSLGQAGLHYSTQEHKLYLGMVENDKAYIYDKLGNFVHSVEHYFKAVGIFDKIGEEKEKANSLGNLAIAFYRLNDKRQSVNYFKEALSIQDRIGDVKRIASTLGNLVTVYSSLSLDSALLYQHKLVSYSEKLGVKTTEAQALSNLANLQFKLLDFKSSFLNYSKANDIYKSLSDVNKLTNNYLNCALVSDKLNDSIQAELYFQKAYELCLANQLKPLLKNYYEAKSNFYRARMNYTDAFLNFELGVAVKDSLVNEKTQNAIAELNIKYQTEKKELQLAKLETEQKKNQLELEKQQGLFRINQLLNTKRQEKIQLLEKDKELREIRLREVGIENERRELENQNQMKSIQLLETSNSLQEGQIRQKENAFKVLVAGVLLLLVILILFFNQYKLKKQLEEQSALLEVRNTIAKDLHDEIGSTLTSINILSKISTEQFEQNPSRSLEMMRDVVEQSKKIQQSMSDIVWAIRPDNEKLEALAQRLREYCSRSMEPLGIQFEIDIDEGLIQKSIPVHGRKELLLMSKELLNNVVKHSMASKVIIQFQKNNDGMKLIVMDNGQWSGAGYNSGTGMKSLKERAKQLGGSFSLEHDDYGTTAMVNIPFT